MTSSQAITPAITWIRDGVLVNRMHINPVAFAVAYWLFENKSDKKELTLEQLINFGFARSGISCAEKMTLFEHKHSRHTSGSSTKIESASAFYNSLASAMAHSCSFFPGALPLLQQIHKLGTLNFITSAVEQDVLDLWAGSAEGQEIAPFLTEILGKRKNFAKGRDHFAYVSKRAGGGPIYVIADAPVEIATASQLRSEFKIKTLGFAHAVKNANVVAAMKLAATMIATEAGSWKSPAPAPAQKDELIVNSALLNLPNDLQTAETLKAAGADYVVSGDVQTIMDSLSATLLPLMESGPRSASPDMNVFLED